MKKKLIVTGIIVVGLMAPSMAAFADSGLSNGSTVTSVTTPGKGMGSAKSGVKAAAEQTFLAARVTLKAARVSAIAAAKSARDKAIVDAKSAYAMHKGMQMSASEKAAAKSTYKAAVVAANAALKSSLKAANDAFNSGLKAAQDARKAAVTPTK